MTAQKPSSLDNEEVLLASKTMQDLRAVLWAEINDLRAGKSTPHRSNAIAKLAAHILDSARLEIQNKWTRMLSVPDAKERDIPSIT